MTATASILLAALTSYGIVPGPTLMDEQPDLVWTLLASLLIGNALAPRSGSCSRRSAG